MSFSPYQSPVRQTGNQMTRDASFSPAGKPHHDSLESSEEAGESNYVRLNLKLTIIWLLNFCVVFLVSLQGDALIC